MGRMRKKSDRVLKIFLDRTSSNPISRWDRGKENWRTDGGILH